jgi:hypothetical protein
MSVNNDKAVDESGGQAQWEKQFAGSWRRSDDSEKLVVQYSNKKNSWVVEAHESVDCDGWFERIVAEIFETEEEAMEFASDYRSKSETVAIKDGGQQVTSEDEEINSFEFLPVADGEVFVKNTLHENPEEHIYTVEVSPNGSPLGCTCPDHKFRSAFCKHMTAVQNKVSDNE